MIDNSFFEIYGMERTVNKMILVINAFQESIADECEIENERVPCISNMRKDKYHIYEIKTRANVY